MFLIGCLVKIFETFFVYSLFIFNYIYKKNIVKQLRTFIRKTLNEMLIKEEMKVSPDFNNNNFNEQNGAVTLEVGLDEDDEEHHRLNLILSIGSPSGYDEISFYFNLTNKENTKITSKPKSIYNREIAKKHIPKELVGKGVFMDKIKEMLKKLMKMKLPEKFFMETFEDHTDRKQIDYYDNLVKIITDNGYVIKSQGVNPVTKKYVWQFLRENMLAPLSEETQKHWDKFDINNIKKDEVYWEKHDARAEEIILEHGKKKRERDN